MATLVPDSGQYANTTRDQLTGDQFLNTLPPTVQPLIKKYANGELALTPQMTRTPAGASLLQAVTQYDPTFDATNYQKRQQTATAFSKGVQGNAIRAANQTLYHMGNLYQRTEDLNNLDILPGLLNAPINYIQQKGFGDPRQGSYKQSAQAVASELRKVFAGTGGGSLQELKDWEKSFDPNAGETQQKAYIQNGVDLLRGALQSLESQYQSGMGLNKNMGDLLTPEAREVYAKLQVGENPNVKKTTAQKQGAILAQPKQVNNDAEYNLLPSGSTFIGPDKITRIKP
jgi:hypothetical protein